MIKIVLLSLLAAGVVSYPAMIGCDLIVLTGNSTGENVMNTTSKIMGVVPVTASVSLTVATSVEAGHTLEVTMPNGIGMGFVHVSSGSLAPVADFKQPCSGMLQSDINKNTTGLALQTFNFIAPATAGTVTVSIAYAMGYGPVKRFSQDITITSSSDGSSSTGSDDSTGSGSTGGFSAAVVAVPALGLSTFLAACLSVFVFNW